MTAIRRAMMAAAGQSGDPVYVEDVFSTYLYTGNGSTQTITNGIDVDGEGGMVWCKLRNTANSHGIFDTERGATYRLDSSGYFAESPADADTLTSFNSDGFSLGADSGSATVNGSSSYDYVSWTFRKQAGFFDVVTYTGTGSAHAISHGLGSAPGMIIIKNIDQADAWQVYHKSNTANPETDYLVLNTTAATADNIDRWNDTLPTSTEFTVGTGAEVNTNTENYVAYLFADDDQQFGAGGDESIIKCGTFNAASSDITVDLGWEAQYVLVKPSSGVVGWYLYDSLRGLTTSSSAYVKPNTSAAETTNTLIQASASGFNVDGPVAGSFDWVYMAIRRPMKVPEAGTEVFHAEARTGTGAAASITGVGFSPDIFWSKRRTTTTQTLAWDRLRGQAEVLTPPSTAAASTAGSTVRFLSFDMGGYSLGTDSGYDQINANGQTQIDWLFKRAPKFMDIVAYTGNTAAQSLAHNLTITPELMIVKARSVDAWFVYYGVNTKYLVLNTTAGAGTAASVWNDTSPTASVFTVGTNESVGAVDYIAYLFATLAGVSKVGSYTGTAATLTIDCGFAAGARFILIKRTDSTGDWYVYDSARGIVAGNDPYLRLNSIAVEVTGTDYIDPESSGFQLTAAGSSTINVSGGEYIFLAIS